jgi:hypothetical protein
MRPGAAFVTNRIESAATSMVMRLLRRDDTGSANAMSPDPGALRFSANRGD